MDEEPRHCGCCGKPLPDLCSECDAELKERMKDVHEGKVISTKELIERLKEEKK